MRYRLTKNEVEIVKTKPQYATQQDLIEMAREVKEKLYLAIRNWKKVDNSNP